MESDSLSFYTSKIIDMFKCSKLFVKCEKRIFIELTLNILLNIFNIFNILATDFLKWDI